MVKKWFLIIFISGLVVASCVLEHKFVNKTFDDMVDSLYTFKFMLESSESNIDTKENIDFLENLHSTFHEDEKILRMLIWHTGLKDIETSISRVIAYVQENDYTEAFTELSALIDYCNHYSLDFSISVENIF